MGTTSRCLSILPEHAENSKPSFLPLPRLVHAAERPTVLFSLSIAFGHGIEIVRLGPLVKWDFAKLRTRRLYRIVSRCWFPLPWLECGQGPSLGDRR